MVGAADPKFEKGTVKLPLESAWTQLEESMYLGTLVSPQGDPEAGCWTSADTGVAGPPRTGLKATWALTEDVNARRNMEAAKDLESISKKFKECMDKRMIVAEYARDRDCEGLGKHFEEI